MFEFPEAQGKSEALDVENGVIRSPRQAREQALAAAAYWTPEAMAEARPYPLPEVGEQTTEEFKFLEPSMFESLKGIAPGLIKGAPPDEAAAELEAQAAAKGGYTYPPPYTRYELPDALYKVYPWITVGKIFFKQDGVDYVASASSIGNYAIWTAGHVVHSGDGTKSGWSTDMLFVPAYRKGATPYGKWPVAHMLTRLAWYQQGAPNGFTEDMAGCILYRLKGKKISQRVGYLSFAWNRGRRQHWHSLGYPALDPFDGETMHDCQASYAYDGTVAGVPPVAIGCDMTQGCSGGPWVWKLLDENALNGNNSYRRVSHPEEINSPYFDDRAKELWDLLQTDTP